MQKVAIVAGPACSGKSTFIKKTFPDRKVIDVFDFQDDRCVTPATVMRSYLDCRDALVQALKDGYDVVLEHTLLKAKRRPMYIDAIRSVTDADIEMYWFAPDVDTYCGRLKARNCFLGEEDAKFALEFGDVPDVSEGYSKVTIITE